MNALFFSLFHGIAVGCAWTCVLLLIFYGRFDNPWALTAASFLFASWLMTGNARTTLLLRSFSSEVVEERLVDHVVPGLSLSSRVVLLANGRHPDEVRLYDIGCMSGLGLAALALPFRLPANSSLTAMLLLPLVVVVAATGWYRFRLRMRSAMKRCIGTVPEQLDGELHLLAAELTRPHWWLVPRYLPHLPAARNEIFCTTEAWQKAVLVAMQSVDFIVLDVTNIYVSDNLSTELDWIVRLIDERRVRRRKLALICAHHDHVRAKASIASRYPGLVRSLVVFNDPTCDRKAIRKSFFILASDYRFLRRDYARDERARTRTIEQRGD
jgi:hypothetical protein